MTIRLTTSGYSAPKRRGSGAPSLPLPTSSGAGSSAETGLPAWITALDVGEWVSVPSSNGIGDVAYGTSPGGTVSQVVNDWSAIATSPSGDVYFFGGGHSGYAGNEIYKLALNQASPVYSRLNDPTASVTTDVSYYGDGKPSARHTYQAICIRGTELVCCGGAGVWGSGSVDPEYTDIFDLETLTWDTQVAAGGKYWITVNHATGDIYGYRADGGYYSYRHLSTGNSWTVLGNGAVDPFADFGSCALDTLRGRIWRFGGHSTSNDCDYWEIGTGGTNPTLTGAAAAEFDGSAGPYAGVDYDAENDCILKAGGTGGTVYKLDCDTLACTEYSTTGATPSNSVNGVNGRFKYIPDLKGFIYVPSWGNAYFLRTVA